MKKKLRLHQSVYGNVSQKINYKEDEDWDNDGIDNEEEIPEKDDAYISDVKRGGYDVSIEQKFQKNFDDIEDAENYIKNWFKKNNVWYNVWFVNERGQTDPHSLTESEEDKEELEEGFLTPEDQLQVDLNRDELEDERMDSDSKVVTSNELEDVNELQPLLDDEDEKELLYGMTESKIKLYRKLKESIKRKSLYSEKEKFHRDSVIQLADQMSKYISKHEGNVNAVVNDITIGLFMAFSTYYKNDGDKETSGSDILKKVMKKLSSMITEYPELETGDLKDDFKLDDEELEDAGDLPAEDGEDVNLEEEDLTDDEILDEENEHEFHEEDEEDVNLDENITDGTGSDSYNEEDEEELEEEMIASSLSGESETQPQIRADLPQNMNPYKDRSGKYKKKEYTKVYR